MSDRAVFPWFLPTGGDDRAVGVASHGGIIGADDGAPPSVSATHRPATRDSLTQIAARVDEYRAAGITEFVMSGYPRLEEAYTFGEGVLPRYSLAS